jgi:hypothetical protein
MTDSAVFGELEHRLMDEGPSAAISRLCALLRERKDYSNLFYALLLKKRHELGVSLIPTGPAEELPASVHQTYEDAIRDAARLVGGLYLDAGNIPHAWVYFRMLGEPQPVAEALDRFKPGEEEDIQPLIEIAYHQAVHPRKGFDWILERYGICNAITTAGSPEPALPPDIREYCIKRLIRALYSELCERLQAEIARKEKASPARARVPELVAGRDWLFEEDAYHIDVSHLSAVVQMSIDLSPGEELALARELCAYGQRLSCRFLYPGEYPFEDQYRDYGVYLAALAGDGADTGVDHFRAKIDNAKSEEEGTRAAEVLVMLLSRLNRPQEALAVARRHLVTAQGGLSLRPSFSELCHRAGDYASLAEVAREQQDPVQFLAGLITHRQRIAIDEHDAPVPSPLVGGGSGGG